MDFFCTIIKNSNFCYFYLILTFQLVCISSQISVNRWKTNRWKTETLHQRFWDSPNSLSVNRWKTETLHQILRFSKFNIFFKYISYLICVFQETKRYFYTYIYISIYTLYLYAKNIYKSFFCIAIIITNIFAFDVSPIL